MKYLLLVPFILSVNAWSKIELVQNKIIITDEKAFISKLEIRPIRTNNQNVLLKETGAIIANVQTSYDYGQHSNRWVSLDEKNLVGNDLTFKSLTPQVGLAFGNFDISSDYASQVKVGSTLHVHRYGIKEESFQGHVTKISKSNLSDLLQIHFIVNKAQELIAGTSCEVEINSVQVKPIIVGLLSLLHVGKEDFVVFQDEAGQFYPKHVTVLEQDLYTATVLAPVNPKHRYVNQGAILLKPLVNKIMRTQETTL